MYVEKRVSFDPTRDNDIITFLDGMTAHKANQLIRELLRGYMKSKNESQLDRMESKLDLIVALSTEPMSFGHSVRVDSLDGKGLVESVPEEIVVNIDNLGV